MNNESMSLSFSIMSVYEYYYCTKGTCVLCFMHKGMYLISLLIVQKCYTRVGATGPSQQKQLSYSFSSVAAVVVVAMATPIINDAEPAAHILVLVRQGEPWREVESAL